MTMTSLPRCARDLRRRRRLAALAPGVAASMLLTACGGGAPRPSDVSGRYIVSISDADIPATAIFDGLIPGSAENTARDSLTVIRLPIVDRDGEQYDTPFAQLLGISNSVSGPPNALSVSRDGTRAYVIESRGPRPGTPAARPADAPAVAPGAPTDDATTDDLPVGTLLTAVDLSDAMRPAILATVKVGNEPLAVDARPAGDAVAVVVPASRQQLVVVPTTPTGFGEPAGWPIIGLDTDENLYATCVQWHPSGDFLAVTLPRRNQVVFYRFTRDADGSMSIAPWGAPVTVGNFPYSGKFTPDGRHFITADMEWDTTKERPFVGAPAGRLSVVRFDSGSTGSRDSLRHEPTHTVVSSAPVGVNPEGLAISPDGRTVVTSNLVQSFLPAGAAGVVPGGSLSLLTLDERSGALTPVREYEVPGMPAGLTFDARGEFVVVTQFRSIDPSVTDGVLSFWRLRGGRNPTLENANFRVGVGKGPHGVLIVR